MQLPILSRALNRIRGNPDEVVFEPTAYCNLKCPLCIARSPEVKERGHIDLDAYKRVVDDLAGKTHRILFSGRGEPLAAPNIIDMIAHATETGIASFMNSNGLLVKDDDFAEAIVDSGLRRINLGYDGLTQETYETFRKGGKLADLDYAINLLAEARKRKGVSHPVLQANFIVTKHNVHELSHLPHLKQFLPVDKVQANLAVVPGWYPDQSREDVEARIASYIPDEVSRYVGGELQRPEKRCGEFKRADISWEGNMHACFFDSWGKHISGNVFEDGFFPVWNSAVTKALKQHVKQKALDLCTHCPQTCAYQKIEF